VRATSVEKATRAFSPGAIRTRTRMLKMGSARRRAVGQGAAVEMDGVARRPAAAQEPLPVGLELG
jgi:hypothetical protein